MGVGPTISSSFAGFDYNFEFWLTSKMARKAFIFVRFEILNDAISKPRDWVLLKLSRYLP